MTIAEWLKGAAESLENSGCPDPAIDSRWIAEDILHLSPSALRFEANNALNPGQLEEMNAEKNRLEEERAQNARMMEELLALKAQLQQQGAITSDPTPAEDTIIVKEGEPEDENT